MSYPSGSQGYYGAYTPQSVLPGSGPAPVDRYLGFAVVALGLASYLFSYGPTFDGLGIGWGVRFAVLAGLLAAVGLLPQQTPNAKAIAALAGIGFLDELSDILAPPASSNPGWAVTVIVVLNGLQAAAAIGALLAGANAANGQRASKSEYDAYADYYAQAAQYYGQYGQQQSNPDTLQRSGAAQAQQTHQVAAPQQASASHSASYADYVGNYTGGQAAAPGTAATPVHSAPTGPQAGLPSVGQAQGPAQQHGFPAESERRPSSPQ